MWCCRYVGGYYGACSEAEMMQVSDPKPLFFNPKPFSFNRKPVMMQEIYTHGPVAVGIEVYPDLLNYRCACVTRVACDDV